MSLEALTAFARRELEQLRYPVANWVLPRKGFLDVLVVGGGMCGQTATFALLREGVRNLRCVDRAPRALWSRRRSGSCSAVLTRPCESRRFQAAMQSFRDIRIRIRPEK